LLAAPGVMLNDFRRSEACICPGTGKGNAKTCFFRRFVRRSRREETRSTSGFRLPVAPKVRTIKVAGIVRRRCSRECKIPQIRRRRLQRHAKKC
jgi:hypothetical protein